MEKIKICLISCVSQKTNYPTKCKDLYISPLFKKTWNYVRDIEKPQGVYILSALHGLIRYDAVIEPYDKTLLDMSKEIIMTKSIGNSMLQQNIYNMLQGLT